MTLLPFGGPYLVANITAAGCFATAFDKNPMVSGLDFGFLAVLYVFTRGPFDGEPAPHWRRACAGRGIRNRASAAPRRPTSADNANCLTYFHSGNMVIHMKTTLNISDVTMREVKREAARRQQTMSEVVETALRIIVSPPKTTTELPALPEFSSGGLRVNIAHRDALYDVMGA